MIEGRIAVLLTLILATLVAAGAAGTAAWRRRRLEA